MSGSQWNIEIFRVINDWGKQYVFLNPAAIFLAEYMQYVLLAAMFVYWFARRSGSGDHTRNRMMVIQAGLAFIVAEVLGRAAGLFVSHHQPFAELPQVNQLIEHAVDNSFPSDHTMLFFSVCVSFWLVRKKEGWLWLAVACCVAVSRVWVGVHYPVDIAAGALSGALSAVAMHWLVPRSGAVGRLLDVYERAERRVLAGRGGY